MIPSGKSHSINTEDDDNVDDEDTQDGIVQWKTSWWEGETESVLGNS